MGGEVLVDLACLEPAFHGRRASARGARDTPQWWWLREAPASHRSLTGHLRLAANVLCGVLLEG